MQLSIFFRSYYTWLEHRAAELSRELSGDQLGLFIHQATLVLACEREILRPGLLSALLDQVPPDLQGRLCDEESRASLERRLSRLCRARSAAVFRFELGFVREALAVAGLRAESWALFAEAVLPEGDLLRLETIVARCQDRCSAVTPPTEHALRVDVLH